MAAKSLSIVPKRATDPSGPPRALGKHGRTLWDAVTGEYDLSDCGGREMLALACQALDRAEDLRERIEKDGAIIRTKAGLRDHPALRHELACRSFIVKTLGRLGLDVEAIKPIGRPPVLA